MMRRQGARTSLKGTAPAAKLSRTGESGFTLLEVMASLAILGLGVITVLQLFSGGLNIARQSDNYTAMALLARDKINEAIVEGGLKEGAASGAVEGMEWRLEVSPYRDAKIETGPNVRIMKVTSTVARAGRSNNPFTLTTLRTVSGQGPNAEGRR